MRNVKFLVCFQFRPHPCLLPQEKGNVFLLLFSLIALTYIQPVMWQRLKTWKPKTIGRLSVTIRQLHGGAS